MRNVKIKKVNLSNIEQLQKIGIQSFTETYSSVNSEENMTQYLENNFATAKLKTQVANKNSEFYFAELEGDIIGYLKINIGAAQTNIIDTNALEIERIYVLSKFHGKKVGQILYEKAIEISEQKKASYIWLGVWEKNPRAIRFYEKNGFVAFDKHLFYLGDDKQTDVLMKRTLE
ncbi:GNAT family N-acetyltransferase [Maribacter sp.]|uniref:GNAT family N-acetyltransferase n=1 Tax=Maribacter sp. TaxID=1897614 RepID=UPI0025C5F898|nr:GNAT family N-acetyltransferase [Maribacter sp.]